MYIDIVPNRNSPPAVLLRESRREGGKMVKTTIANLSKCPREAITALRLALILFTLIGGWGVIVYVILWVVMPYRDAYGPHDQDVVAS